MALPVSLPPYQACRTAGQVLSQGVRVTGVPVWMTTAVLGLAVQTEVISWVERLGRDMVVRS